MRIIYLKIFIYLIFLNLNFQVCYALSSTPQKLKAFAESRSWQKLLHYKVDFLGQRYGMIEESSRFYLSSTGHTDPYSELITSIETFNNPHHFIKKYREHPQCLFPARYNIIKQHLKTSTTDINCPNLIRWKNFINADKIAIIFASQFISNPASIMGHTFLKFIDKKRVDYLNLSFGYAANMPIEVGAYDYITKGLFGGFQGVLSETPYFRKVYEYNNMEQRDIWEYKLNLNPAQISQLLDHIWELKHNAEINYFFIDENCSYLILAMIQAILPEKELFRNFPLYVLPHETVRRLEQEKVITKTTFRPSIRRILVHRYNNLDNQQQALVLKSIQEMILISELNVDSIDTILDYASLKKQKKFGKLDPEWNEFKNQVLLLRSKLPTTEEYTIPPPPSPLKSHLNLFVEYGFGEILDNNIYHQFIFRPGFHKTMDDYPGFIKNSSFNFFETNFRYYADNNSFKIYQISFIDVANMAPFTWIDPILSWKFNAKYWINNDYSCIECKNYEVSPSIGISNDLSKSVDLHSLLTTTLQLGSDLPKSIKSWVGLEFTTVVSIKRLKLLVSQKILKELIEQERLIKLTSLAELRIHNILPHLHLNLKSEYNSFLDDISSNHDNSVNMLYDF